jgi:hypothetical protein
MSDLESTRSSSVGASSDSNWSQVANDGSNVHFPDSSRASVATPPTPAQTSVTKANSSLGVKVLAAIGGASVVVFAIKAIMAAALGAALLANPVGWVFMGLAALTVAAVVIAAVTKNTELLLSMSQGMKGGGDSLGALTVGLAATGIGLPVAIVTALIFIGIGLPLRLMGSGIEKLARGI